MNPAPDAEIASVGEFNHNWIVNAMTEFILEKLKTGFETPEYRWSALLNPPAPVAKKKVTTKAKTAKTTATTKAKTTKPKKTAEDKPKTKNASAK
jgi:hypothetical protein